MIPDEGQDVRDHSGAAGEIRADTAGESCDPHGQHWGSQDISCPGKAS